jgi:hypothetical protein
MARRAYKRVLKTGKVVNVRASFGGSPNRRPGNLGGATRSMKLGGSGIVPRGGIDAVTTDLSKAPLHELASQIERDWGNKVNFAARPYLSAMRSMQSHKDMYGADSGRSIVAYFLSNSSQYRGPKAKAIKAELRRRIK